MTLGRDDIPETVSLLLDGRPVRWSDIRAGDYDGRERTLEIFDADAREQRGLLRALRPVRADLRAAAGGPLVIVFHTPAQSRRLHGEYLDEWRREHETRLAGLVAE